MKWIGPCVYKGEVVKIKTKTKTKQTNKQKKKQKNENLAHCTGTHDVDTETISTIHRSIWIEIDMVTNSLKHIQIVDKPVVCLVNHNVYSFVGYS